MRTVNALQAQRSTYSIFATHARRVCMQIILIVLFTTLMSEGTYAIDAEEYQIKAAYLYQFTRFVEWPASSFKSPEADFELCVIGVDRFGVALSQLTQKSYNDHNIVLHFLKLADQVRDCQIIYISSSEVNHEAAILAKVVNAPVLTVSSLPGFVEHGGIIGFIYSDNHIRFTINRGACEHHDLVCGAKLLEVAVKIVDGNNGGETR